MLKSNEFLIISIKSKSQKKEVLPKRFNMADYILLNEVEMEQVKEILRRAKFEDYEVIKEHYFRNGKPRHGVSLEKAKEIYSQFEKIAEMSKNNSPRGYKYTVTYRFNKKTSYSLCFFLDERPMKLFNAIHHGKNIDKRVMKRYFGFSK